MAKLWLFDAIHGKLMGDGTKKFLSKSLSLSMSGGSGLLLHLFEHLEEPKTDKLVDKPLQRPRPCCITLLRLDHTVASSELPPSSEQTQ